MTETLETLEAYASRTREEVPEEVVTAARYLESRGKRFMIDFGYHNAVSRADALFAKECAAARRPAR